MAVVVISGISRGIGLAVAQRFSSEGYTVCGFSSSATALQGLAQAHPQWHLQAVDAADKAALQHYAAQLLAHHPRIDVLVNNAGRFLPGGITTEADGVLEQLLAINLAGPYHLTRALLPGLTAGSTVVNVCSTASFMAYPNGGSYAITKFGLLGMSRTLREELKPQGIRVMALLPGATLTDSWAGAGLPADRFIQPADLAELVYAACALPARTVVEELLLRPLLGDI